jgi:hypothetical protein
MDQQLEKLYFFYILIVRLYLWALDATTELNFYLALKKDYNHNNILIILS